MSLAQIQARFHARVVGGEGALAEVSERSQRGLRVYAHAYGATLVACLRDTFEKTHAWLGDDGFDAAARTYVAATPSRSWTLSDYGDGFPDHLAALQPDDPEIGELAWLDLKLRRAFDGPDVAPLDPATLAGVDWETATLRLVPTLAVRAIATNSPSLWSAMEEKTPPPAVEMLESPAALRVWRQDLVPTFRAVPAWEARAIAATQAGETFGALCATLERELGEAAAAKAAASMLGAWIADGVLAEVLS